MKKMFAWMLVLSMMLCTGMTAWAEQTAVVPAEPASTTSAAIDEAQPEQQYSLTTGLPTDKPYKAMAVQFDNSADARPQMNMSKADVIYESEIARGGYTRYTAIFNDEIPNLVEAVRSARIMHVDISLDWSAAFIHFGGQQMKGSSVYDYAKTVNIKRFDGLSDSNNFYRDNKRVAPYNVVGRLGQMYEATEAPEEETVHTPLKFSAENPTIKGENVSVFRIPYGPNIGFYPSYEYLADEGVYRRYYNRQDMLDGADNAHYDVENVIVMYADYSWYDGASDRPIVALTGTNKCEYFIGGKHFEGTWSRSSVNDSTVYYDGEGSEVFLKPGKTFIQIVRTGVEIEIVK